MRTIDTILFVLRIVLFETVQQRQIRLGREYRLSGKYHRCGE